MKKILFYILFFFFASFQVVFGVSWTTDVTQDGGGGACEDGGECSASEFNALSGDYGGSTFYFSGGFSTRIDNGSIYGTSGNPVVLDGYEAGDCDPLNSVCSSSALLNDGMDIGSNSGGPDHITVQDFRMTKTSSGFCFGFMADVSESDGSGWMEHLIFRRNYIYETYGAMGVFYRTKYLTVENNKWAHFAQGEDVNSALAFNCCEDTIIKGNVFEHDEDSYPDYTTSANFVATHGMQRTLVENNVIHGSPTGSCLTFKEDGFSPYNGDTDDVIIRYNLIYDCAAQSSDQSGKGISLVMRDTQSLDDVYVYANFVFETGGSSARASTRVTNVRWWSNIWAAGEDHGLLIGYHTSGETPPDYAYCYNNTIVRANKNDETWDNCGGIVITSGTNLNFKNNILWNNRPSGGGSKYNQFYSDVSVASLEHNTLYHSDSTATWYYDSGFRSLSTMQGSYDFEDDSPAGTVTDPGFTDPNGADNTYETVDDDYTLDGNHINNGVDLGGTNDFSITVQGTIYYMGYAIGLDPSTDWTATPLPTVVTASQDDYGSWERGAYVYTGNGGGGEEGTGKAIYNLTGSGKLKIDSAGTGKATR